VDLRARRPAALEGGLDLLPGVDPEGDVLDPDVVVAVLAPVGRPQADQLVAELQVDDLLGAAVARIALGLHEPERREHGHVEGERPLHVGDGQVEVMIPRAGMGASLQVRRRCGRIGGAMANPPLRTTADLSAYPDLVVIHLGMRGEEPRGLQTLQTGCCCTSA
jgi:hypothetical protein